MGRYDSDDRHLIAGSGVLINLLGITDQAALVLLATFEIGQSPLPEPPDGPGFTYLLRIHGALFRDISPCARQVRDVDIAKGGSRFANGRVIDTEGARLAGLGADRFAARMAWYMGELNVLHPFRDGNGRALRAYMRDLAQRAGHPLTWGRLLERQIARAATRGPPAD